MFLVCSLPSDNEMNTHKWNHTRQPNKNYWKDIREIWYQGPLQISSPTPKKKKPGTRIYNFHLHIIQYYEHVTSDITTETTDLCPLEMNIKRWRHAKRVLLLHPCST